MINDIYYRISEYFRFFLVSNEIVINVIFVTVCVSIYWWHNYLFFIAKLVYLIFKLSICFVEKQRGNFKFQ